MKAEINLAGELRITAATETEKYAVLMFVTHSKSKLKPRLEADNLYVTICEPEIPHAIKERMGNG